MKILLLYTAFVTSVLSHITYPTDGTTWKVGQSVHVSFKPGQMRETVNIFFDHDRSTTIGGGSIARGGSFQFTVSPKSVNPAGGPSQLVAVHRVDRRLQSVDNIKVHVVH